MVLRDHSRPLNAGAEQLAEFKAQRDFQFLLQGTSHETSGEKRSAKDRHDECRNHLHCDEMKPDPLGGSQGRREQRPWVPSSGGFLVASQLVGDNNVHTPA